MKDELSVVRTEASQAVPSSKASTQSHSNSNAAPATVVEERQEQETSPPTSWREASPAELQERLVWLMEEGHWEHVDRLCEHQPCLARGTIDMVCQGENSTCLPIHYASGQKSTPVSTIDALVTAHPSSLLTRESSAGRLPLHLALLRGASYAVVRYLCKAQARSLAQPDEEGNLPLHYASMYCNDAIIALLVQTYPQACSHSNKSDRMPLHLLCARCWDQDKDVVSVETLKLLVDTNPAALSAADRRGRMPLHVSCSSEPRADVLNVLVPLYPKALLETDKSNLTPLEMARKFSASQQDNNVVLAFLQDRTNRERRKKYKFLAPFKHVSYKIAGRGPPKRGKPDIDALNLHYCYG